MIDWPDKTVFPPMIRSSRSKVTATRRFQAQDGVLRSPACRTKVEVFYAARRVRRSLLRGRFPAQVFLFGGVNADYFAVGDEQRNHD